MGTGHSRSCGAVPNVIGRFTALAFTAHGEERGARALELLAYEAIFKAAQ
jgi:hypothetical protein